MPLFEFVCESCDKNFEELLRSISEIHKVACPSCGSQIVSKKISAFSSRASSAGNYSFGSSNTASACSAGST